MTKRLTLALFLGFALLSLSVGTRAPRCGMMPQVTASSCGCCATMKSCVVRQESPVQSAAAASESTQQLVATIAPVVHEVFGAIAPSSRFREVCLVQAPVRSTGRLALLCRFLI